MQVEYTGRQIAITPSLRRLAEEGLDRVGKVVGRSCSAHVILTEEKYRHTAEVTVQTKFQTIVGLCESTVMETAIKHGIPGIEDRVNLLYTYGVKRDRIDLDRFVDSASTRAAKLFGLYPRKGTVAVGSDADLVVYDPTYRGAISVETQRVNNDYNAFEGMEIEGRPTIVTVRGRVQVRDGQFVGERGRGRLLRREPTHF